jgi:hypothetical protein
MNRTDVQAARRELPPADAERAALAFDVIGKVAT